MKKIFLALFLIFAASFGLSAQMRQVDEQLAAQYFMQGEYEKSAEIYERLFAQSNSVLYYDYLLRCYENLNDRKSAEKLIQKQQKANPDVLTYYVDLGLLYSRVGEDSKARKQYEKAQDKLVPSHAQVLALGQYFSEKGLPDQAITTFQKGRELMKNPLLFLTELTPLYAKKNLYDVLANEWMDYLLVAPKDIEKVQVQLQNVLSSNTDGTFAMILKTAIGKKLHKYPDNLTYADMLIWLAFQEKDFEFAFIQAKAIDKRSAADAGSQVFRVAMVSASNADYDIAAQAYDYLIKKGKENPYYMECRIGYLDVEFQKATSGFSVSHDEIKTLSQRYKETLVELGKKEETIPLMKNYAVLLAFYANDVQGAADILYEAIEIPTKNKSLIADCKLTLGDILLFAGDVWEASLLYSQVEKAFSNDPLGALAKFRNAKLSYYIGEFEWSKAQLNVLRASTTKLIANDAMELSLLISDNMDEDSTYSALEYYSRADLAFYRNHFDEALLLLDSISTFQYNKAILDEVLMKEAQIRMKQGLYAKADTLLNILITDYSSDILADDALFMLGELYEKNFKNLPKANEYYEKLILDYSASLYVTEARKRLKRNKELLN